MQAPANSFAEGSLVTPNKTYEIIDINWYLEVNNTYNVTATGTIQELFGNLTVADPLAAAAINQSVSGTLNETNLIELLARDASSNPTTIICNEFPSASAQRIRDGITYLKGVPGKPSNGPGPGTCGRVSCSYDSAIYWCNDVRNLPSETDFERPSLLLFLLYELETDLWLSSDTEPGDQGPGQLRPDCRRRLADLRHLRPQLDPCGL